MTVTAFVYLKLRTLKTWLDKCLKSPVSEATSTSNMVNVPKHCLKSPSQYPYHISSSLARKLCSKKCLLLRWQILGLLVKTFAAHEKCPALNRDNLTTPIQMMLSEEKKLFLNFLPAFPKSKLSFEHFEKKKLTLIAFVFSKVRTPNTWLDKCLKSSVSENPSTSNMVNVHKHCLNLHRSTFIGFIDHWQGNCVRKSLSIWYAKSQHLLLTHCLPTKGILFLIETI